MSANTRVTPTASRLGLGALLLVGIFAWAPALYPGFWQTLQGFVPIFNVGQGAAIAAIGVAPDLWRGTGSATNLLTQPWVILGFDQTAGVRFAFVLAFVIGGCAMYAWLRPMLGDRAAGLAGLVYMLQPIFLSTVYVDGSLADALVLAWLPLALAGLATSARHRSVEGRRRGRSSPSWRSGARKQGWPCWPPYCCWPMRSSWNGTGCLYWW